MNNLMYLGVIIPAIVFVWLCWKDNKEQNKPIE